MEKDMTTREEVKALVQAMLDVDEDAGAFLALFHQMREQYAGDQRSANRLWHALHGLMKALERLESILKDASIKTRTRTRTHVGIGNKREQRNKLFTY